MSIGKPTNQEIAEMFERIADLLERRGEANPYRVQAYRTGAATVRQADISVAELAEREDKEALQALPGIGKGLAWAIIEYTNTGRSRALERLQGKISPEDLFTQVPGIGEELAQRIVDELKITTLEALEQAAYDGRLDAIEGFGEKRVETVQISLAGMLSRAARRRIMRATAGEAEKPQAAARPDVVTLLEVDEEYRRRAEAGELHLITPRRFNPERKAWLPVLHTERGEWDFTAMFSNTARAHELGTTDDWVVIYFEKDGVEDQATVVTETVGRMAGLRVVRGREAECRQHYAAEQQMA